MYHYKKADCPENADLEKPDIEKGAYLCTPGLKPEWAIDEKEENQDE